MKTKVTRRLVMILSVCLLLIAIPVTGLAAANFTNSKLDIVTNKASTLATGVSLDSYTVYDKNGDQVKMFVTTADMSVDTVEVFASYKDMNPEDYGMSKLTGQVASFNEKAAAGDEYYQGTVVAGINASYYNMTTGKPTGTFVMNGIDVTTESEGNKYGYFAVMKDGSVKIGNVGDYSSDKGNIQEAIGIYKMLVVNGEMVTGLDDSTKYPRQTIGITADNKVILMTADGNQAPSSIGLTMQEQAQVMLDLGCVWAGHLDGGGSCTYACKPEGSDTFAVANSPSDGSERSISNGLIIVSTEAQSNAFNKVSFDVESKYVTPGTSISVTTKGVSSSGNSAEIPADVTYEVTNGTFADGVFTAGNEVGEATITAMYNGVAAGTTSINVVLPDSIAFNQSQLVVPFGKTVALDLTMKYGINEVTYKAEDVDFVLEDESVGVIDGLTFTAAGDESEVTQTTITATVKGTEVSNTATIALGKGSVVLYDFEDGEVGNWKFEKWSSTPDAVTNIDIVTSENGQVHSGNYAMELNVDFTQAGGTGYSMAALYFPEDVHVENALRIGMWVYLPDDFVGLWARYCAYSGAYDPSNAKTNRINGGTFDVTHYDATATGFVYQIEEPGWYYFSLDTSKYSDVYLWKDARCIEFYTSDRDGADFDYYFVKDNKQINTSTCGNYTLYVDEVTVDYSSAVEDREAPVFGNVSVIGEGESTTVLPKITQSCEAQTVTAFDTNTLTISASVSEDTTLSNATGLDASTAKCYVDGYEVSCKFANGNILLDNHEFTNGIHTIRFEISDKAGNSRGCVRKIEVQGSATNDTIQLVPRDESADKILVGSLYYVDLKASDLANIKSTSVVLDLNSVSTWELEGMEVANGFTASYAFIGSENQVKITFERNGNTVENTNVLASIPARAWQHSSKMDPTSVWSAMEIRPMDLRVEVDSGKLVTVDGEEITFTSDRIRVDTELYGTYAVINANGDYSTKTGWHTHTAEAINDLAATCTEDGYTGRTFCKGCNSVIDWGTKVESTGHSYDFVDGVLQCTKDCGEKYTGVYEGKDYVDGVLAADGWSGNSYYVNGEKLTGIQKVTAPDSENEFYYDFGDDGISTGKYTGLIYDEEAGVYRYSQVGVISSGWKQIGEDWTEWYYFDETTFAAVSEKTFTFTSNKVTYQFEETGKIVSGVWVEMKDGTRYYYGPDYHKLVAKTGNVTWVEIDGNTYGFDGMGYRHEGICFIKESNNPRELHVFETNGVHVGKYTGLYDGYYYSEGFVKGGLGLVKIDNDYYYISQSGKPYTGTLYLSEITSNGYLPAGSYFFKADGKLDIKQGIVDGFYYENGALIKGKGIIKVDNDYYYIGMQGQVYTGSQLYISEEKTNGYFPAGSYFFKEDGKMDIKQGIVDGFYYEDGVLIKGKGLIKIDGYYYYIGMQGQVYTGSTLYISTEKANGYFPAGSYSFKEDGKMDIKQGIVDGFYYEDGVLMTGKGVIEIDGNYYYIGQQGQVYVGSSLYISKTKANGYLEEGIYKFNSDGKIIIE